MACSPPPRAVLERQMSRPKVISPTSLRKNSTPRDAHSFVGAASKALEQTLFFHLSRANRLDDNVSSCVWPLHELPERPLSSEAIGGDLLIQGVGHVFHIE